MQIDTEEFDCFQIDSWGRNEQELLLADVSGESWFDDEKSLRKRNIFDVLGTSDEWQGKVVLERVVGLHKQEIVRILHWPINLILHECEDQQIHLLAATCKEFSKNICGRSEVRARTNILRLFYDEKCLIKFVDVFGLFNFACQLKDWLNHKSLQNWSTKELQVVYNSQLQKMKTQKYHGQSISFDCLLPAVQCMWTSLGFSAFKLFFDNCVAKPGSNKKILWHYKKAWKDICVLSTMNASSMLAGKSPQTAFLFQGSHELTDKLKYEVSGVWPNILVLIDAPSAALGWPAHKVPQCLCTFGFSGEPALLKWKDSWAKTAMFGEPDVLWRLERGKITSLSSAAEVPAVEVPAVEVPAVEVPAVEVPAVYKARSKGKRKDKGKGKGKDKCQDKGKDKCQDEDNMNDFFQQLFALGEKHPEMLSAMKKSFQESNGTVLDTQWGTFSDTRFKDLQYETQCKKRKL